MVQSLLSADHPSPNPTIEYANHASRGAASKVSMNVLCTQVGVKKPRHVTLTRLDLVFDPLGVTYRERKGSILSSGSVLGLFKDMSESHSWVSTEKSSKSPSYSGSMFEGGLSVGKIALIPTKTSASTVFLVGKCTSTGAGVITVIVSLC